MWVGNTLDGVRRDFRLVVWNETSGNPAFHPVFFYSTDLQPTSSNGTSYTYEANVQTPSDGWTAFFIEFNWPSPLDQTFHITTGVSILPQTFPFPDCYMESCLPIKV